MNDSRSVKLNALIEKGVKIPNPDSIEIGKDISVDNISGDGVIIYPGCRLNGSSTFVSSGVCLGEEAPVTIDSCQLGPDVSLKGGFHSGSVFLEGASTGSGAHVRKGTIIEEQASIAHTVGLKQTILFPFVTLGSLINFCDIFMAGGTNRRNHSEVGSSYIHFNYTPNQDKATPSLLGDVPHGVMLDQPPIFLGGQGGLVGPCQLAYGSIIAAGSVTRKDVAKPNRMVFEAVGRSFNIPHSPGVYRGLKRILANNFQYTANMFALRRWYLSVRPMFLSDRLPQALLEGLQQTIDAVITERIQRLKALSEKMESSIERYRKAAGEKAAEPMVGQQKEFAKKWPELEDIFKNSMAMDGNPEYEALLKKEMETAISSMGKDYILSIKNLGDTGRRFGSLWLQGIVDEIVEKATGCLPIIFSKKTDI